MKIAVLGPQGTFSDKAYLEYRKHCENTGADFDELEPVYFPTIDDVFYAVCPEDEATAGNRDEDICTLGIVPIENTLDGYVQRTLDLLLERDVYILDENKVSVQFALVGNVNQLSEIKKLYVQFKANGQCRRFINSLNGVEIITTDSNMESYYKIGNEAGAAAIVPKHIADEEKDRFVIENVTDADKNHTRFVVFKCGAFDEQNVAKSDAECKVRIPVYIMPSTDRPGILFEILKGFYEKQVNLISIISRPTKQKMGTYNFYLEIDGLYEQLDEILGILRQIQVHNDIKILGVYDE